MIDLAKLKIGDRLKKASFGPLTTADFVRYAGAGGDFNPIHYDLNFARAAGFPSVFGQGLFTAGILGGYAAEQLGITQLKGFSVRYVAQVWPGDVLDCDGEVTEVTAAEGGLSVRFDLVVTRAGKSDAGAGEVGDVILKGGARATLSQEGATA